MTDYTALLPPLSSDEYEALKADIAERGCLVPVEVDENGRVLDGAHRLRACGELGIEPERRVREGLTDQQKAEHALALNIKRRHLGDVAWARAFKQLAELRGVRLGRGGDRRSESSNATLALDDLAAEMGTSKRTAQRRVELADALEEHPDLAEKVDRREMEAKRALRVVRERESEERKATEPPPPEPSGEVDLRGCAIADLDVEPGSAALVFTDPPYPAEFLPAWNDLAEFASRALEPGRLLIAYSGHFHLPAVMSTLEEHLDYVWLGSLVTRGPHNQVHRRHIRTGSKPLLLYSAGTYELGPWFEDTYTSEARTKDAHEWQQSLGAARYFIETLTKPGELVVDPFLGSGTTAVACAELGRRFVGCDIDSAALDTAKRRLAA